MDTVHVGEARQVVGLVVVVDDDPALGPKEVGVWPKDGAAALQRPQRRADLGPARQEYGSAVDNHRVPSVGHPLRQRIRYGRVYAHALLDDGLEVGEFPGIRVGDDDAASRSAVGDVSINLGLQLGVDTGVGEEVEEDAAKRGGGGVGAGDDLQGGLGHELVGSQAVARKGRQHVGAPVHIAAPQPGLDGRPPLGHHAPEPRHVTLRRTEQPRHHRQLHEPGQAEGRRDGDDGEARLPNLNVPVDVGVGLQIAKRLAEAHVADDVERQVLHLVRKIKRLSQPVGREVLGPDQVHELGNVHVDGAFEGQVFLSRVLDGRVSSSAEPKGL